MSWINLTHSQIQAIKNWAAADRDVKEVTLFGSRAKGAATRDSDVDLAIALHGDTEDLRFTVIVCELDRWQKELSELVGLEVKIEPRDPKKYPPTEKFIEAGAVRLYP